MLKFMLEEKTGRPDSGGFGDVFENYDIEGLMGKSCQVEEKSVVLQDCLSQGFLQKDQLA